MSVTISLEQNNLIEHVARNNGFNNFQTTITKGSIKGDGYLGVIYTVSVLEKNKHLHLILKVASAEEKFRKTSPIRKAYEREILMYSEIFPLLKTLSDDLFVESPRCLGYLLKEKEECVVLEDLKEAGYKMWNRLEAMDYEHAKLVFSIYGKLHASGIVLKLKEPEKFQKYKDLKNIFEKEDQTEEGMKGEQENAAKLFERAISAIAHDKRLLQEFQKFMGSSKELFEEGLRKTNKTFTILHGDCWCNNMIFKYEDNENPARPTGMRLLDFQLSNFGSPICDLSYFLYSSVNKTVLDKFQDLLKIYYNNYSRILQDAGLNVEEILTFSELEEQWKIFSKFGLFMTLFVIKLVLNETNEPPNLEELAKSDNDFFSSINSFESDNEEKVNIRIYDVIKFMAEHDFL